MTVVRKFVLAFAGAAVFAVLTRNAARGTVSAGEERAFRAVNQMSASWRAPAWLVMQCGSLGAVPVVAMIALPKSRSTAVALAIDGTAVWAASKVVKRVTKPRPAGGSSRRGGDPRHGPTWPRLPVGSRCRGHHAGNRRQPVAPATIGDRCLRHCHPGGRCPPVRRCAPPARRRRRRRPWCVHGPPGERSARPPLLGAVPAPSQKSMRSSGEP